MTAILQWLSSHKRFAIEAILSLLLALSVSYGVIVHNKNKKLSESLELAYNNIEAYQGLQAGSQQANNVLQLTVDQFENSIDPVLEQIQEQIKKIKVKPKNVQSVATQTQTIDVTYKEPTKIEIVKDTTYNDSIVYNKYTKLYYNINKDTTWTRLDIKNKQSLIVHVDRVYKNKKSFIKRLFTFDFKKINKYKYEIINENDLIKTDSVRVIEII